MSSRTKRYLERTTGVKLMCTICGGPFYVPPSKVAAKYCSTPCRQTGNGKKNSGAALRGTGNGNGYTRSKQRQFEHRLVMERSLGRKLLKHEAVHHKDGNRKNNRLSNLQIVNRAEHMFIHIHARQVEQHERDRIR